MLTLFRSSLSCFATRWGRLCCPGHFEMFQVSSQSGRILPLEAVASFCEEHNIVVVVDGTQSCQLLLSAQKKQILDRVDFFVMSTHKWIGNVKTCGLIRLISVFDNNCTPSIFYYKPGTRVLDQLHVRQPYLLVGNHSRLKQPPLKRFSKNKCSLYRGPT